MSNSKEYNKDTRIGPYSIRRTIGKGSFGCVYAAEVIAAGASVPMGEIVALKQDFGNSSASQWRDEERLMREIRSVFLPRYYDIFDYDGNLYLVMEFVPGHSLMHEMDGHSDGLDANLARGITQDICEALICLEKQKQPLIHRDIKPDNVIFSDNGRMKLVDLGLVKEYAGMPSDNTRRVSRSDPFAPPEQRLDEYRHLGTNESSDIYSLGAILYYLLTGHPPVSAEDRVRSGTRLHPPIEVKPEIPKALSDITIRAMALDKKDRYPNAISMQIALNATTRDSESSKLDIGQMMRAAHGYAIREGFEGAFPTFHSADYGRGRMFGLVLLRKGGAEFRDVLYSALHNSHPDDVGTRFRRTHDYAYDNGYVSGFPTMFQAGSGEKTVCGTILLTDEIAEWKDVRVADLGYIDLDDLQERFRRTHDYAMYHGYEGGLPNLHQTNYGDGRGIVCGTILLKKGSGIVFRDILKKFLFD
jgi:hypothetical protein